MNDTSHNINSETQISMDGTGIVLHIMIAGVLVGITVLSWTQIKVNTPEQREATFKIVQKYLKSISNITVNLFTAIVTDLVKEKIK